MNPDPLAVDEEPWAVPEPDRSPAVFAWLGVAWLIGLAALALLVARWLR